MKSTIVVSLSLISTVLLAGGEATPLESAGRRRQIDPSDIVPPNDVLYTTPSVEPWEAMPVGGGDLSAMVRWDGSLHLHLTKSDCWGSYLIEPLGPPAEK